MLKRKVVALVVAVMGLAWAQTAAAQPRWGHERLPESGACFYENVNFGGRYFCVRAGESLPSMPSGMNDRISSIRLFGGARVTVFRDPNMRGRSSMFERDLRDLRREGWNDTISAIDVSGRGGDRDRGRDRDRVELAPRREAFPEWGRSAALPREGACFYDDANFRGQYFCVARGSSYNSLPRGFNDRISSIRVFGARVAIFRDRDFRGRSREVNGDVRDLRGDWRDDISSIRVW